MQQRFAKQRKITFEEQIKDLKGLPEIRGEVPYQLHYMLDLWLKVAATKNQDSRVGYPDLESFSRLTKQNLEPWEVELILEIDQTWARQYNIEKERRSV